MSTNPGTREDPAIGDHALSSAKRIAILGNAGTGKSTLAAQIGRLSGLEPTHLDSLLWRPGWEMAGEDEFGERHAALLRGERWIVEGIGYPSTLASRIEAADLVILLRYPLWRCYWWSLKRELRRGAIGRPADCPMPRMLGRLLRTIRQVERTIIPEIEALLERRPAGKIARLRSPAQVPALLDQLRRSPIRQRASR